MRRRREGKAGHAPRTALFAAALALLLLPAACSKRESWTGVYRLSGAELEIARQGGGLAIAADGQSAVDLLLAAGPGERAAWREANERSIAIVGEVAGGRYGMLAAAAGERADAERVAHALAVRWRAMRESGLFRAARALGTAPDEPPAGSAAGGPGALVTVVRARFGTTDHVFRFHWDGGRLAAIGDSLPPHGLVARLEMAGDSVAVARHPGLGRECRLLLVERPRLALVFTTPEGSLTALRER